MGEVTIAVNKALGALKEKYKKLPSGKLIFDSEKELRSFFSSYHKGLESHCDLNMFIQLCTLSMQYKFIGIGKLEQQSNTDIVIK